MKLLPNYPTARPFIVHVVYALIQGSIIVYVEGQILSFSLGKIDYFFF